MAGSPCQTAAAARQDLPSLSRPFLVDAVTASIELHLKACHSTSYPHNLSPGDSLYGTSHLRYCDAIRLSFRFLLSARSRHPFEETERW